MMRQSPSLRAAVASAAMVVESLAIVLATGAWLRADEPTPADDAEQQRSAIVARLGTPYATDGDGHRGTVYELLFSPDGKRLASQGADNTVRIWSVPDGKMLHRLDAGRILAFSPDGSKLLTADATLSKPNTLLWDVEQGKRIDAFPGRWDLAAFNRDGTQVCYVYRGRINALDVASGETLGKSVLAPPAAKAISRAGDLLVSTSSLSSNQLRLSYTAQGHTVRELSGNRQPPLTVTFSPDGQCLAAADRNHQIHVWEVATGKLMAEFSGLEKPAQRLDFSPDGRLLASAGRDGVARIWELISNELLATLEVAPEKHKTAPRPLVTAVAFSPNGRYLATGGSDSLIILWDVSRAMVKQPDESPLTAERLNQAWDDLALADARRARKAMYALSSQPEVSLPYLAERLHEVVAIPREEQVRLLIRDLDSDDYMVRERATQDLQRQLNVAIDVLKQELRRTLSAEVRFRIRLILSSAGQNRPRFTQAQLFRFKRLIQVLEGIDQPQAVELLKLLADKLASAEIQGDARRALNRLGHTL